ncbi:MAG: arylamine N-acetyltransferase [Candidatus Sulfotelmatobacter sp.]
MLDVNAYLERINYRDSTAATLDTLRAIHRAHMLAVPFENLDIARGRKIVLDQESLIRKIVRERRGGFCYELNGAFAALLRSLDFQVTLLSARVARDTGGEGPEFDHLCLQVDLEEPWLADGGFGESFLEPLWLHTNAEQTDPAGTFRIDQLDERLQLEKLELDGGWKRQYSFTLQPRHLQEFADMCHHHQTSPESPFTGKRICTRATSDGRVTLADRKLIVTKDGRRDETMLASEQERIDALKQYFGIVDA